MQLHKDVKHVNNCASSILCSLVAETRLSGITACSFHAGLPRPLLPVGGFLSRRIGEYRTDPVRALHGKDEKETAGFRDNAQCRPLQLSAAWSCSVHAKPDRGIQRAAAAPRSHIKIPPHKPATPAQSRVYPLPAAAALSAVSR